MKARHRGFILVVVLWVLLALTVMASALAAWVSRTTEQASLMAADTRDLVDQQSTLATIQFLAATRPLSPSGLFIGEDIASLLNLSADDPFAGLPLVPPDQAMPLDDRPLRGFGETVFGIQDEQGLLSLRAVNVDLVDRVLEALGVSTFRRRTLVARLADQTRHQTAPGLLGAGRREYEIAGYRPLPRRDLLAPLEVRSILGWQAEEALWEDHRWRDGTTVLAEGALNVNSAPGWLLELLPEFGTAGAAAVVRQRQGHPIRSLGELNRHTRVPVDTFQYSVNPAPVLRITLWSSQTQRGSRYHLRLLPFVEVSGPWRIELAYPVYGSRPDIGSGQTLASPFFAASANRDD